MPSRATGTYSNSMSFDPPPSTFFSFFPLPLPLFRRFTRSPREFFNYLRSIMYQRRNKSVPLSNQILVAGCYPPSPTSKAKDNGGEKDFEGGVGSGKSSGSTVFLGYVDLIGTAYEVSTLFLCNYYCFQCTGCTNYRTALCCTPLRCNLLSLHCTALPSDDSNLSSSGHIHDDDKKIQQYRWKLTL
jgi:hypothetical protein